jgi:hypothetical protein
MDVIARISLAIVRVAAKCEGMAAKAIPTFSWEPTRYAMPKTGSRESVNRFVRAVAKREYPRRIGSVRGVGDDDRRALRPFTSLLEVGLGDERRRELRERTRCRIQRKGRHPKEAVKRLLELVQ